MKNFNLVILLIVMVSCGQNEKPLEKVKSKDIIKESENWLYGEDIDKMDGTKSFYAVTTSVNEIDFEFPYDGGSECQLFISKNKNGSSIILTIDKGQFSTTLDNQPLRIKFDQESPINYNYDVNLDGSTDAIYISNEKRFINKIKNAKKLKIEALFFNEGYKVIDFDVTGLKWE